MPDSKPVRVLLIDDDEEDYLITRASLNELKKSKYLLEWVCSYAEGLAEIRAKKHDIYLIDYRIGPDSGLELLKQVVDESVYTPMILLTGQGDQALDEEAARVGAADFLLKGTVDAATLERSIRYSLRHFEVMKQMRQLHEDAERTVKERTADLANAVQELKAAEQDVRNALEKEKQLGEMKSRFVSMASHEFRTPLATILSSASLIARYSEPADEKKRNKHIKRIYSSVKHLTDTLNDFLSIGRLDADILPQPAPFDIVELAEEVIKELEVIKKPKQRIAFRNVGGKTVILDKQLTRNILVNLLSNALKYSPDNISVIFETKVEHPHLGIVVEDKGIGIPQQDHKQLFSMFYRAQNATHIEGTGLGLNIVKRSLELMEGEISFISEVNKGTSFTVKIPLNQTTRKK